MTITALDDIVVRTMRGTGEQLTPPGAVGCQIGMLADPVDRLVDLGCTHVPVPYPASIAPVGGTVMYHESVAQGKSLALAADKEGKPWIGIGYSLGALIFGDIAGQFRNCIGMFLLADPKRHRSQCWRGLAPVNNYGCAGERKVLLSRMENGWAPRMETLAVFDDPITSLPAWNGFRAIAQVVTGELQTNQWNNVLGYANLPEIVSAAGRYLGTPPRGNIPAKTSRHVVYGTERVPNISGTYTDALGDLAVNTAISYAGFGAPTT